MGQKTHAIGFRLGIVKTWSSKWYEEKQYAKWLHEDIKLKKFIKDKLKHAGVAGVDVERAANKVKINIQTARPGIVIGKRGAGVEQLKKDLVALLESKREPEVDPAHGDEILVVRKLKTTPLLVEPVSEVRSKKMVVVKPPETTISQPDVEITANQKPKRPKPKSTVVRVTKS